MNKQEILTGVPESKREEVEEDFRSEGATVVSHRDADGTFTITATFSDVPPHLATPGALRAAAVAEASGERLDALRGMLDAAVAATAPAGAALAGAQTTALQRAAAQAIVNIFETGEVLGDYGQVTLIAGDTGHLTYGRSQTTLGSGNLAPLLARYCANPGARFASRLQPFLARVAARDVALDRDAKLHNLLRAAADDPVMRGTQDVFFDTTYWQPAAQAAERLGIVSPLGVAVVYDSHVHGSWALLRDRTSQQAGVPAALGERRWVEAYVAARHAWLATHDRSDLRATVYRMDAFERLIAQNHWGLDLPLVVRGREISALTLAAQPPGCYDGPQPGTRPVMLQSPLQRGLDVRLLQLGLSLHDADIKADGVFGPTSVASLKAFQSGAGLPATGAADVALVARLAA